jgi:hypothetical protein
MKINQKDEKIKYLGENAEDDYQKMANALEN